MPQPAISRIERGTVSPSVETLERLLRACGQELEAVAVPGDRELDWSEVDDRLDMSPADRARYAVSAGRSMLQFRGSGATERGDPPFDPLAALFTLMTRSVEFVVIGGFAAVLRGSPGVTDDVDICYAQTPANRGRLADALIALEARIPGIELAAPFVIEDALEAGEPCSFETIAGPVDAVATPGGTNGYNDLVVDAERLDAGECPVLVASLDDLVRMKVERPSGDGSSAVLLLRAVRKRLVTGPD